MATVDDLLGPLASWWIAMSSWSAEAGRFAVPATPLDQAAPPGNAELQRRIIREHVAVIQFGECDGGDGRRPATHNGVQSLAGIRVRTPLR